MILIRAAKLSDAKNLSVLAETTFRDTFTDKNTSENMDAHCHSSFGEIIQAKEISNPEFATIIAEVDKKLVAYAQLRWSKAPECVPANFPGEIHRLYVDRNFHGKGLAHELMSECLKVLKERNTDVAWLGVWESNPRAIAFYRKFSFQDVGAHIFALGTDPQRDIILMCPISGFTSIL